MSEYNPKAPNELADAQLEREKYESEQSKAVAKRKEHDEHNTKDSSSVEKFETNKESYNTIPGE